jgi:hypothetical protein
MTTMNDKLARVLQLIDAANAEDPNRINVAGRERPAELVYGERMTAALHTLCGKPSEVLSIAARAQHLERWTSPRSGYPEGRAGYLKWRTDLKAFHARRAGELMAEAGYDEDDIARVAVLINKKGIKRDPEVQMLEDAVCLTFLAHYAADFIAKHEDDKVIDILAKTARKMSADGLSAAAGLPLDERLARLLGVALERRSGE